MFDRMDLLPQHVYNGDPFHVKLWLDTLTPYDRTLYLDADMMATARDKTVEQLLGSLSGVALRLLTVATQTIPAASANGPNRT